MHVHVCICVVRNVRVHEPRAAERSRARREGGLSADGRLRARAPALGVSLLHEPPARYTPYFVFTCLPLFSFT